MDAAESQVGDGTSVSQSQPAVHGSRFGTGEVHVGGSYTGGPGDYLRFWQHAGQGDAAVEEVEGCHLLFHDSRYYAGIPWSTTYLHGGAGPANGTGP